MSSGIAQCSRRKLIKAIESSLQYGALVEAEVDVEVEVEVIMEKIDS
jgi:hypothetical protein